MGTRLYPMTKNTRNLELLADVLVGTTNLVEVKNSLYKVYKELNEGRTEEHDGESYPVDLDYEWHCLFANSDVNKLEGFKDFGWGSFNLNLISEDKDNQDRYGGSTTDTKLMERLLWSSCWGREPDEPDSLSAEEIIKLSEGFCWV